MCLSGRLWQPSGVLGRGPRPGVMGSGMRRAQLSRSLCQSVRVPLLDQRHPRSLCLKERPLARLFFHQLTSNFQFFCLSLVALLLKFDFFLPIHKSRVTHTCASVKSKIKTLGVHSLFICVFTFSLGEKDKTYSMTPLRKKYMSVIAFIQHYSFVT